MIAVFPPAAAWNFKLRCALAFFFYPLAGRSFVFLLLNKFKRPFPGLKLIFYCFHRILYFRVIFVSFHIRFLFFFKFRCSFFEKIIAIFPANGIMFSAEFWAAAQKAAAIISSGLR